MAKYEPMSTADLQDLAGRWVHANETRMARELLALRATIAEQAATIASLRDRERTIREAVNAYLSEQITSKRKLTDAMLAHLPELHGGDSDY